MNLPNDISGWVKFLANNNATVVNSPAGPTLRMARNSANPILMTPKSRQRFAKMLVDHFGTIEAVNEAIGKTDKNIDKSGKVVIGSRDFQEVKSFLEGMASVKIKGKWGFINKAGEVVIEPKFNHAFGFSEGLAAVWVGKKVGFINKRGELVIEPRYDMAWSFDDGLASVSIEDKSGYIDKAGRYVWGPTA